MCVCICSWVFTMWLCHFHSAEAIRGGSRQQQHAVLLQSTAGASHTSAVHSTAAGAVPEPTLVRPLWFCAFVCGPGRSHPLDARVCVYLPCTLYHCPSRQHVFPCLISVCSSFGLRGTARSASGCVRNVCAACVEECVVIWAARSAWSGSVDAAGLAARARCHPGAECDLLPFLCCVRLPSKPFSQGVGMCVEPQQGDLSAPSDRRIGVNQSVLARRWRRRRVPGIRPECERCCSVQRSI